MLIVPLPTPPALEAVTLTLNVPVIVGVPLMVPAVASILNPLGNGGLIL